jgi:hypothetical protein
MAGCGSSRIVSHEVDAAGNPRRFVKKIRFSEDKFPLFD